MATIGTRAQVERWRSVGFALIAALTLLFVSATPSEARGHHARHSFHAHHHQRHTLVFRGSHRHGRHAHFYRRGRRHYAEGGGEETAAPRGVAAMVVDGKSGRTLFALNEHQRRHPASVTKVMTLYLLFEQLEKGRLRLDSPLMISQHAAAQAPSKLGLEPGETIAVEDAIKAVVTKSANDIAVAIAENIGGDEDSFAEMMTAKAHALGMADTHFANASGLPNSEQNTTAYDLTVLGRAIQERFPHYYRYFSTHSFVYNGAVHRNHNHLLGRVEGMDGIKTGYTAASGFNLLTSVRRSGHHIVAVVLGGATAGARDRYMAQLIEDHIDDAGEARNTRAAEEQPEPATVDPEPTQTLPRHAEAESPASENEGAAAPRALKTKTLASLPQAASDATSDKARPAFVSGVRKRAEEARNERRAHPDPHARAAAVDGSTSHVSAKAQQREVAAATTPSSIKHVDGERTQVAKFDSARPEHGDWMIQLGATDDAEKANELLARARTKGHAALATAKAFTEKVQKGHETLYRARFAGLEEQSAESACKTLRRSGFSCFATRN